MSVATITKAMSRSQRLPFVPQMEAADCGAACLAMVLRYYGRYVRLDELREAMGSGRDGINALTILNAARAQGLRGRGVQVEIEELECLEAGTILHWQFRHFVVFEKLGKNYVDLLDPAAGRRRIPLDRFCRSFTGVALLLEPGEGFSERPAPQSSTRRYFKRILAHSPIHFAQITATTLLLQICALAVPLLTKVLIDRIVPRQDYRLLTIVAAGAVGIVLFQSFISFIRTQLLLAWRTRLDLELTGDFVEHLVSVPYSFFSRRAAGDLLTRLNSTSTIREILTLSFLSGVLDGLMAFVYLILLLVLNQQMALLVLGLSLIQAAILLLSRGRAQQLLAEDLEVQAKTHGQQVQMLSGIETLKASGAEEAAVSYWSKTFAETLESGLRRGRMSAKVELKLGTVRTLAPILLLWLGSWQVLGGTHTLGSMIAATGIAGAFLAPLSSLVVMAMQLQLLGSYIERIDDVLQTPAERDKPNLTPAHQLTGKIEFEEVSFRYRTEAPEAVNRVSLKILPGQSVAIVGRTGSGKSTLAKLLLGLYQPTGGRILFDGVDLSGLDAASVRRQIGVVMQQPHLFGATIREAIAFNDPQLTLEEIEEAARMAYIYEEIRGMLLGYETPLVDGGVALSGGQRQRIALARALAKKPQILLLDEATSHLDAITESRVHRELTALRATRIIIAHRLSTIYQADLILVMEEGQIVEQGSHEELLAMGGAYAELAAAQVKNVQFAGSENIFSA